MKKKMLILIVTLIAAYMVFKTVFYFVSDISENIEVGIREITVTDIAEAQLDYTQTFSYYNWSDELKEEISADTDSYAIADVSYKVKNNSDKIEMCDVQFYPCPEEELKDMIQVYNTDNGNHPMCANPQSATGIGQTLVIKKNGKTNEEIKEMLLTMVARLEYTPAMGEGDTGHGYSISGTKTYEFKIADVIGN